MTWFGHIERMENEEFVKKVHRSSVEGPNRPLGRWKDKVKEYVSERGARGNGLEWARREYMDRKRWRSICRGPPLWERRGRGVRAIDSLIDIYQLTWIPSNKEKRNQT